MTQHPPGSRLPPASTMHIFRSTGHCMPSSATACSRAPRSATRRRHSTTVSRHPTSLLTGCPRAARRTAHGHQPGRQIVAGRRLGHRCTSARESWPDARPAAGSKSERERAARIAAAAPAPSQRRRSASANWPVSSRAADSPSVSTGARPPWPPHSISRPSPSIRRPTRR